MPATQIKSLHPHLSFLIGSFLGPDGRTGYGSVSHDTRVCIWLRKLPLSIHLSKTYMWSSLPLLCSAALLLHHYSSAVCELQHPTHRGQTCKLFYQLLKKLKTLLFIINNIYLALFAKLHRLVFTLRHSKEERIDLDQEDQERGRKARRNADEKEKVVTDEDQSKMTC